MSEATSEKSSFAELVRVSRRRKWLIVACVVIAPTVAFWMSDRQPRVYRSTAQVLLTPQNAALSYAGINNTATIDPIRYAATQTFLARSPSVAADVVARAKLAGLTVQRFLNQTSVAAVTDANLLTFTANAHNPYVAQQLAGLYASSFTRYRRRLDTAAIHNAIGQLNERLGALPKTDQSLRLALLTQIQSLQTTEALQRESTYVSQPAGWGGRISPRPKRDAILGLILGVIAGVGLAFLRELLDTRLRTADEIAEQIRLPLLGQLPTPPKHARDETPLVMLDEPFGPSAELFRMLRTSVDLASIDLGIRTLMVTSSVEGEGKTTTACNLAVAFAAAGRTVVLVDLDLRRPMVHSFFHMRSRPGLTDVALGTVGPRDALMQIDFGDSHSAGTLAVLPSGPMPPNPGEFVATAAVGDVLAGLRNYADIVIVDTPPALQVAEAMAISSRVDAILVVTRLGMATRQKIGELRRLLERTPTTKLGFVITGAESAPGYTYDHYSPYTYPAEDVLQ